MKKLLPALACLLFVLCAQAQNDISVIAINQPVSGCALTSTQNVTIRIFNYGNSLPAATSFNVSYTINAGSPVTELVTLGSTLLSNSTLNYTFTTQANLSVPGTYTFSATCNLAGDVNPSNNAFTNYTVTNTAASVGGTVSGGTNVCVNSNSGNLTLSGHTGSVVRWEYSTDGGATWFVITNTTTTQAYSNLTIPTQYRAVVQNGSCNPANSSIASITIDPATVGGSISPSSPSACTGSNSGTLVLSGKTGSVVRWETSTDGGVTWTNIANTTTSQSYLNLTVSRIYRAFVQSGACTGSYSSLATVTVLPTSVGGTTSPANSTECAGNNSGTITLSGNTGNVVRWESSIDGGSTWNNVVNTTSTLTYTNLAISTIYRARIQSSPCSPVYSSVAAVNITQPPVGGTLQATGTTCAGNNSGSFTLTGYNGTIVQWEYSTPQNNTWNVISNTTSTQAYSNLTNTTLYRVLVQNGVCPAVYSSTYTLSIDQQAAGGEILTSVTQVCEQNNNGTLDLQNYTGNILQWESSTDGGTTWNAITNTSASQPFTALNTTTQYRALVQNSALCPQAYSDTATIQVDALSVAGTTSGNAVVCSSGNNGTVNLTGYTGNITSWQQSTDGGNTWNNLSNTNNSLSYTNLFSNTQYRAVVQNGVCPSQTSTPVTIQVNSPSTGGVPSPLLLTVCSAANSGTITLAGNNGSVVEWQSSTDGAATWVGNSNTSNTQSFNNLTGTTLYKALVQNTGCPQTESAIAVVNTVAASSGGILTSTAGHVCIAGNAGTVILQGQTGSVIQWETSTDNGNTWDTVANNTAVESFSNLVSPTLFKVLVQNSPCPAVYSGSVFVTIDSLTQGGILNGGTTVCAGSNTGNISLLGNSGSITGWEVSSDAGITWTPISNTTATQAYVNLTDTTIYRVLVQYGACPPQYSSEATINAAAQSNGGNALPAISTVCGTTNGGQLNLSGNIGDVVKWQSSTDEGNTWNDITNTTSQLSFANITTPTWYRAVVQNAVCGTAFSSVATVNVGNTTAGFAYIINGLSVSFINLSENGTQYFWNFGDNNTETDNNPVHTYSATGTYQVTLTSIGDCDTGTITQTVVLSPSDVQNLSSNNFAVYPNPATDKLMLATSQLTGTHADIRLLNVAGEVVYNSGSLTVNGQLQHAINVAGFAPGVYTIQLRAENSVATKRLVISH